MRFSPFHRWLVSLLWLSFLSPVLMADDRLQTQLEEANRKLSAGDAAGAMDAYNRIIEQEPKVYDAWVNRAVAKSQLNDFSGARADLAQAISLEPGVAAAYRVRAVIRFRQEHYEAALSDLDKAIQLEPGDARLYTMRAEVRIAVRSWEDAQSDLNQAIELDPRSPEAFFQRAKVYEELQEPARALADYSRVLELVPDQADALHQRAWLHFAARNWPAAIADGRKVLTLVPESVTACRVTGYAEFGAGDYAGAADTLGRAADLAGDDLDQKAFALFIRHLAAQRAGKPDDRLKRAVATWPADTWAATIGCFLTGELSEEKFDELTEAADPAENAGRECEANFYIGMVRLQAGDKPTARLRFRAAIATKVTTFVEFTLSERELERLKP